MIYIKRKKILISILIIIVLLLSILLIWQWDNVKALYMGIVENEETLLQKRVENDRIITDTLEKYPELNIRDMTEEEKKALDEGTLSRDELLLILQGKGESTENTEEPYEPTEPDTPTVTEEPTPPEKTEPEPQPPTVTEPPKEEEPVVQTNSVDEQISALVAEMYVLKAEFTAALKNLESTTLSDYAALPNEQKTAEVKTNMMNKVLDVVTVMEKDCDAKVNKVLDELTALLKASSKDISLVEAIRTAYKNEKTITKAEYINTYFK